jgi:DNA-binding protein Alba
MADPLHTTRIEDHPPFQSEGGTTSVTSGSYVAPKYPSVYIGRKPLRVYNEAAETALRKNGGVWIEARGDLISRAVLVALRVMRSKAQRDFIMNPLIDSVRMAGKDGKEREVPTIAILLCQSPIVFSTVVITDLPGTQTQPLTPLPHTGDPLPDQVPITVN